MTCLIPGLLNSCQTPEGSLTLNPRRPDGAAQTAPPSAVMTSLLGQHWATARPGGREEEDVSVDTTT